MTRIVPLIKILILFWLIPSSGASAMVCEGRFDSRVAAYTNYYELNRFLHGRLLEGIKHAKHSRLDGSVSNPGTMPMTPRNETEESHVGAGRVLRFRSGYRISGQLHQVVAQFTDGAAGFEMTPYLVQFVGKTFIENTIPGTGFSSPESWEPSRGYTGEGMQGFINPLGPIQDFKIAPHLMTAEEWKSKGIFVGQDIELTYQSGVVVRGQVKAFERRRSNNPGIDIIRFEPGTLSISLGETDFINDYGVEQDSLLLAADVLTHAEDFQLGPWVPYTTEGNLE